MAQAAAPILDSTPYAIWVMNGLQIPSSAGLGTVGPDWTIQGTG